MALNSAPNWSRGSLFCN